MNIVYIIMVRVGTNLFVLVVRLYCSRLASKNQHSIFISFFLIPTNVNCCSAHVILIDLVIIN